MLLTAGHVILTSVCLLLLLTHFSSRAGEKEGGQATRAGGQREGGTQTGESGGEGEKEERIQRSGGGLGCEGTAEEKE